MKLLLPALFLVAGLLPAQQPGAFTWYLTSDFQFQQNGLATREGRVGEDPYLLEKKPNQFQESLALFGAYRFARGGDLSAGATLRTTNFYKQEPNFTLDATDNSIYRWFVKYRQDAFTAQAGDFHALLGQGFVLSVLQNDTLLRERTVKGLEARWQETWLDLRGIGGTVLTEVKSDGKRQKWEVLAAEAQVEFLKGNRFGVRGSQIKDLEGLAGVSLLGRRETKSLSLSGSNLFNSLSYYGEYGRLDYRDKPDLDLLRPAGHAVYGNLTYRVKNFLLQAEHKKYERFDNGLNNLPLADREEEVNDLVYSEGTRLFAQLHLRKPDISVFASAGRYTEGPYIIGRGRDSGHNVYGGFIAEDLWDAVSASYTYGYRNVGYPVKKSKASAVCRLPDDWSLEWTLRDKRYTRFGHDFHEQDLNTQLARASWGAVWILKQHSRDPIESLGGGRNFFSAGVRINLKQGAYVEASGGKLRGGEVCSGGQCVNLPPFKGWKLAAHFQFK